MLLRFFFFQVVRIKKPPPAYSCILHVQTCVFLVSLFDCYLFVDNYDYIFFPVSASYRWSGLDWRSKA